VSVFLRALPVTSPVSFESADREGVRAVGNPPSVEDLQRRILELKQELIGCIQREAKQRQANARAAVTGVVVSGVVCGLVGFVVGRGRSG
jgi:hypothetical protein